MTDFFLSVKLDLYSHTLFYTKTTFLRENLFEMEAKKDCVRDLLCAGADVKTIVDIVRVSKTFVYDLKVKVKAGVDLKRKVGRVETTRRIAVREARQTEDETILAWHARLRSLFQRAHPALDATGLKANVDLRDQFVLGMLDQDVVSKVWHQRPGSYGEALTMAIIQSRATERPPPAIKWEPNINALGSSDGGSTISRAGPPGSCWDCRGNHYARHCPKGGKGAGRGRGRGARAGIARRGRGRAQGRGGRTRGSGRFTGRRRIQGLQEEAEAASIGSIGDIFEDNEMDDYDHEEATMEGQGNF